MGWGRGKGFLLAEFGMLVVLYHLHGEGLHMVHYMTYCPWSFWWCSYTFQSMRGCEGAAPLLPSQISGIPRV